MTSLEREGVALKSLYYKITFIIIGIVVLSGANYFIITTLITNEENISHNINVAGRERMLAQKINNHSIKLLYSDEAIVEEELLATLNEFEENLIGLMNGNEALGLLPLENEDIKAQLKQIEINWLSLKADIHQAVNNESDQVYATSIIMKSEELIDQLDIVVKMFEDEGKKVIQGLTTKNAIFITVNLLFALVIFSTWHLLVNLAKSEKKYRMLIEHSPLGIVISKNGKFQFINNYARKALGLSDQDEMIGESIYQIIPQESSFRTNALFCHVKEEKQVAEVVEEQFTRIDGTKITVEVMSLPFNIMGGHFTIFHDITDHKRSESEFEYMFKELNNIKTALNLSNIVEITDDKGVILYVNDKFSQLSKYEKEEVVGKTHRILNSGYHSKEFIRNLWETIQAGRVWEGHVRNRAKDGSFYWVNTMIIPFINNEGMPYQYLTIRNDITDRKNAEKAIRLLATTDDLTQLSNRRVFEEKLKEAIADEHQVAVMFLDLDRFKIINDTLGHLIGDQLLIEVADRLRDAVADMGIISRQGGDEFTMLITNTDNNVLKKICERIITKIKQPYVIEGNKILVTCSIGVSTFPHDGKTIEDLMKNADIAMYDAKDRGKDNFSFYKKTMVPFLLNHDK